MRSRGFITAARVSHRKLLEWRTADHAGPKCTVTGTRLSGSCSIIAGLSAPLTIVLLAKGEFAPTAFFVIFWAASPLLMHWMGKPSRTLAGKELSSAQTHFLRGVARETWRYFDDLVGPGNELAAAG